MPQPPLCRNLEQKFRCQDLEAAHSIALAAGATASQTMLQRDVFFNARCGRLKLRTIHTEDQPRAAELIAYDRPDGAGERFSAYRLVPIGEPEALEAALAAALGVRGIVRKRRRLLLSRNTRLHFDEVEGLGTFVEFEVVLDADRMVQDAREQIAQWREVLGLTEPVPRSYMDLLGASTTPLLHVGVAS